MQCKVFVPYFWLPALTLAYPKSTKYVGSRFKLPYYLDIFPLKFKSFYSMGFIRILVLFCKRAVVSYQFIIFSPSWCLSQIVTHVLLRKWILKMVFI